jgi:hypothetical protein
VAYLLCVVLLPAGILIYEQLQPILQEAVSGKRDGHSVAYHFAVFMEARTENCVRFVINCLLYNIN